MHRGGGISARCVWEVDPVSGAGSQVEERKKFREGDSRGARCQSQVQPGALCERNTPRREEGEEAELFSD